MSKRSVSAKVYQVNTGISGDRYEGECVYWAKHTLVAPDAELAISFAKVRFTQPREYVVSVELVAVLDEQAAQQSVQPTRGSVAQKVSSKSKGSAKPARG